MVFFTIKFLIILINGKSKIPENYPTVIKKVKPPEYEYIAGIVRHGNKILITKRSEDTMLGGLWELPNFRIEREIDLKKLYQTKIKDSLNINIKKPDVIGSVTHQYSHFTAIVKVLNCKLSHSKNYKNKKYKWISLKEVDLYPFSKINHKIFDIIKTT